MINVDKTYVCHWTKLVQRKEYMNDLLYRTGITDIEWVECYDKENWNEEEIRKDYPKAFDVMTIDTRRMRNSEISLALKHCWIVRDISAKKYKSALVLEDDVNLCQNFVGNFNAFSSQLPEDWDVCWVGSCCDIHAPMVPNKQVYPGDRSRCTHAFMVSLNGANKMIPMLSTLDAPADHFYNKLIREIPLNNYWFEPSLAEQNTIFKTSIHTES